MTAASDVRLVTGPGSTTLAVAVARPTDARTSALHVAYRLTRPGRLRIDVLDHARVIARRVLARASIGHATVRAPLIAGRRYTLRLTATAGRAVAIDEHHFHALGLLTRRTARWIAREIADARSEDGDYPLVNHCLRRTRASVFCDFDSIDFDGTRHPDGRSERFTLRSTGLITHTFCAEDSTCR